MFPTDTYILKYCPALSFFVASVFYSSSPVVAPNLSTPLRSPFFPFFLFLQTILSLPLSSVPPQVVLSTEHCIVPCYLFLKASSLLGACDIRGLTEHQPVAIGEDNASLAGREAQCRCLPPVSVCWDTTQGHGVNMRD